jgi:hypothetical protein
MRRPRRRLEVSTFPFLAVLLCAMGSLILLLLVLDRRAKAVARARAEEKAQVARAERDAAVREAAEAAARRAEERAAERERRRAALHDELARTQEQVTGELRAVRERESQAARTAAGHRARWRELLEILGDQHQEVAKAERELAVGRGTAAEALALSESARKEAERLSTQLRGLEVVLDELKAARQREAQTYSLLPYNGKRGSGRRPIYVECATYGLVFHPDRKTFSRVASPREIRDEVEARVNRQRQGILARGGQPDPRAYLLMLVRPDGIATYYQTVAALQGREIDFGYEFIDADWVLDLPDDDSAPPTQPWMAARRVVVAPADPSVPRRDVKGLRAGTGPEGGGEELDGDAGRAGGGPRLARGGASSPDLPPLPAYSGSGGGGTGGGANDLPPLPGAAATIRWTGIGSGQPGGASMSGANGPPGPGGPGMGDRSGGSALPPLPGAAGGGGAQRDDAPGGVLSRGGPQPGGGDPGSLPLPSASGARGAPNPDGMLASGPPPSPGAGSGRAQPGAFSGTSGSGVGAHGATGGGGPGAPAVFPFDGSRQTGIPATGQGSGGGAPGMSGPGQPGGASNSARSTGQAPTGAHGGPSGSGGGDPGGGAASAPAGSGSTEGAVSGADGPGGSASGRRGGSPVVDEAPGAKPGGPPPPGPGPGTFSPGRPGGCEPTAAAAQGADEPHGPNLAVGMIPLGGSRPPAAPQRTMRLIGNRDWIIPAECRPDGVVLRNAGQSFPAATVGGGNASGNPLQQAVQQLIVRRQATVRPGDPPYRPQVRLFVYPGGLRTYYQACAALEPLGIPLTRQSVEADAAARAAP